MAKFAPEDPWCGLLDPSERATSFPDLDTHDDARPDADTLEAMASRFGPLTPLRVVALVAAVAFLAAAVGWTVGERNRDPLNEVDVGFMQDMGYHHDQAIQMSLLLLAKDDMPRDLRSFAQEFIIDQRFEQGVFNAILDRFGYPAEPGDEVMGWIERHHARVRGPDLAATGCAAIGRAVSESVRGAETILLAGGGAKNMALVKAIRLAAVPATVRFADEAGISSTYREPVAIAVLGALCQDRVPITLPQVTGCGSVPPPISGCWVLP